jgi:hypothetical protein
MLAEIFMLQLESAVRASEDAAQSKNFRFVPLSEAEMPDFRNSWRKAGQDLIDKS